MIKKDYKKDDRGKWFSFTDIDEKFLIGLFANNYQDAAKLTEFLSGALSGQGEHRLNKEQCVLYVEQNNSEILDVFDGQTKKYDTDELLELAREWLVIVEENKKI